MQLVASLLTLPDPIVKIIFLSRLKHFSMLEWLLMLSTVGIIGHLWLPIFVGSRQGI